ncbi:MAG: hypothetical protein AAGF12_00690 [Myxococcota bacterium]
MKIGFIGPSDGDVGLVREAIEFLVGDADVSYAIYLGEDDSIDRAVTGWAEEIMQGSASAEAFLDRVVALVRDGEAGEIRQLLAQDRDVRRLFAVRKLPPPPARVIEMIDDRIVTVVYDKAVLDEEDIANASLLVYGKSDKPLLKRFGPRYFFTPGPLKKKAVAIIEVEEEGQVMVGLFDPSGAPLWREALQGRLTGRVMITP